MARFEFKLPDIGEGIAEAEISAWHVKVGDDVEEDQQLADMMTDKATVEMESPVAGKILEVAGEVGDMIAIGSVLVVIDTESASSAAVFEPSQSSGAASDQRKDEVAFTDGLVERRPELSEAVASTGEVASRGGNPSLEQPVRSVEPEPEPEQDNQSRKVLASPAVRERARSLGIDLAAVKTSGDRVRHSDLDAFLLYNGGAVARTGVPARQDEVIKLVGLRRKIAENMQEAKRRIPHFTYVDEVDVTALEQTRSMMNSDRGEHPKLTLLPFLTAAMCRTLPQFPMLNARFDDEANVVTRSGAVHMGMATQTENGLSVAVIQDAQNRDIWGLAREILRLADATRSGKATREELSGSTITISSLGPMGGIVSTPVINRPEVAIIAVNKVRELPVVIEGELEIRKMMNLSLSCDHRVVDGWDAASFIQALKKLLESPLRLLSLP